MFAYLGTAESHHTRFLYSRESCAGCLVQTAVVYDMYTSHFQIRMRRAKMRTFHQWIIEEVLHCYRSYIIKSYHR
jgi:hypothetical protein